jgi:hypothetical protein
MHKCKPVYKLWIFCALLLIISGCNQMHTNMKETYAYTFRLGEAHPDSHPTAQADLFKKRLSESKAWMSIISTCLRALTKQMMKKY